MKGAPQVLRKAPLPPNQGNLPFSGVCGGEKMNYTQGGKKSVSGVGRRYKTRGLASELRRGRKRSSGRSWEGSSQPSEVTVAMPGDRYLRKPHAPNFRETSPGRSSEPPPSISLSRRRTTHLPQRVHPSAWHNAGTPGTQLAFLTRLGPTRPR